MNQTKIDHRTLIAKIIWQRDSIGVFFVAFYTDATGLSGTVFANKVSGRITLKTRVTGTPDTE